MKIRREALLTASVVLALSCGAASAQQSQSSSTDSSQKQAATVQKSKPASAKTPKVWTEDDIASVRTPADDYMDQERAQAPEAPAAANQSQPATAKSGQQPTAPPALSNPKTAEDADKMIAWEQKDVNAQQQFINDLKQQVDAARPDQKDRLQKLLQQHINNLAVTQKELQAVQAQKEALEKKPAPGSNSTQQPQSQQ